MILPHTDIGEGITDHAIDAGHRHDITGAGSLQLLADGAAAAKHLHDFHRLADLAVAIDGAQQVARLDRARVDATRAHLADVVVVLDRGHQHAELARWADHRRGHVLDNLNKKVEQH